MMAFTNFALPLNSIFTTPVALAAVVAPATKEVAKEATKEVAALAQQVVSGNFISDAVFNIALPLCFDIGKVLFAVGCIQGIYMLMRSDTKGFINKVKWATTGYVLLRFIQTFIAFIDALAIGIGSNFGI